MKNKEWYNFIKKQPEFKYPMIIFSSMLVFVLAGIIIIELFF